VCSSDLWRKLPPETLRSRTSAICGGGQVDFHSLYGWIGVLRESAFEDVEAAEHTFQFFSLKGMLRDEGWLNSLCIGLRLLLSPARREKMAEIRSHFFEHGNYFSYVVFSARKQAAGRMRLDATERMVA
jgi:hypothetical protein